MNNWLVLGVDLITKIDVLYNQGLYVLENFNSLTFSNYNNAIIGFAKYVVEISDDERIIEKANDISRMKIKNESTNLIEWYLQIGRRRITPELSGKKKIRDKDAEKRYVESVLLKLDSLKFRIQNPNMFDN